MQLGKKKLTQNSL